jgi:hypothetical protein
MGMGQVPYGNPSDNGGIFPDPATIRVPCGILRFSPKELLRLGLEEAVDVLSNLRSCLGETL